MAIDNWKSAILGVMLLAAWCYGQDTRPATMPAEVERLVVEGLLHDARSLGHTRDEKVVGRSGRIVALVRMAERLSPDDPEVQRQFVEIHEGSGELVKAAASAGKVARAAPNDYAMALLWMRLGLSASNSTDEQATLLTGVVADERFAPPIRAAASAELSGIYLRQSKDAEARQACERALALDAYEPAALLCRLRMTKDPTPDRLFRDALTTLRGEPRSMDAAWRVGRLLQEAALHEQARPFYEHARAIAADRHPAEAAMARFLVDDVNLLLDAGGVDQAIAAGEEHLKTYPRSLGLRALVIEAYRLRNKQEQADAHVEAMEALYKPTTTAARRTGAEAAEIAWFYLDYRRRAKDALSWAQEANNSAGDDPFVREVLAAVQMEMGETDKAVRELDKLADRRPRSAAILAQHYFDGQDAGKAEQVLLKAAKEAFRTGQDWRALQAVADAHKVKLPPPAHAETLKTLLAELEPSVLAMGRSPEKFVRVSLAPAQEAARPGEPVAVTVTLTNTSDQTVPLGPRGLLNPTVLLNVGLEGDVQAKLPELTLASLPAPKYLPAGQSVSQTVRVDLGGVEELLAEHPLGDVKIVVDGMVDPLEQAGKLFSSAPAVKIAPIAIRRAALVDPSAGKDEAYRALGYIVRDLKRGSPAEKLRAARQTGSLLACVRLGELGLAKPPHGETIAKPVLLSMMRACLQAPEAEVRAEMIAALQHVRLDGQIIGLLSGNIEDRSGLVRMRLVELLAGKRTDGHQTLLDLYTNDLDPQVREMTAAVKKAEQRRVKEAP